MMQNLRYAAKGQKVDLGVLARFSVDLHVSNGRIEDVYADISSDSMGPWLDMKEENVIRRTGGGSTIMLLQVAFMIPSVSE
ncbi:hypothetical protein BRADI_5g19095v3 [Brachypodium distachyon]|uniref:Uncharacterized protein n=1 Tax=Brachypodium distachyon TaxID=15368 RepID=A0A0Q3KVG2_BRADI|nr:hypothetical protein BRADI_5g19095v3 [Brachypodium distachyon]